DGFAYAEVQIINTIQKLLSKFNQLNIGTDIDSLIIDELQQADISFLEISVGVAVELRKAIQIFVCIIRQALVIFLVLVEGSNYLVRNVDFQVIALKLGLFDPEFGPLDIALVTVEQGQRHLQGQAIVVLDVITPLVIVVAYRQVRYRQGALKPEV